MELFMNIRVTKFIVQLQFDKVVQFHSIRCVTDEPIS